MTASVVTFPLYETNPPLYERLVELCSDPSLSQGFKAMASDVAWMERVIEEPADLSFDAIQTALLASYDQQLKDGVKAETRECVHAWVRAIRNECQFPKWCGGCYRTGEEVFHNSLGYTVTSQEYGDSLAVDVSRFQCSDGTLCPASIQLAFEGGDVPEHDDVPMSVYLAFTSVEARKNGETLMQATSLRKNQDHTPGVFIDTVLEDNSRLVVERLRARKGCDGRRVPERYELTLREEGRGLPVKTLLDSSNAWFLGRYLVIAANDGEGLDVQVPC